VEHWNSTGCNLRSSNTVEGAGATAAGGEQRVSILPLDQWTPTSLTMRMRITSKRASFDGEWATRALMGGLRVCVCAQGALSMHLLKRKHWEVPQVCAIHVLHSLHRSSDQHA
jgi:hypothetical protein